LSSNRKQQERDQRRRLRRGRRQQARQQITPPETVGHIEFSGPMGFMQRHTRSFFLGGIVVMVLSLGSIFFATQIGAHGGDVADTPDHGGTEDIAATDDPPDAPADDGIVRLYQAAPELTISTDAVYEAVIHLEAGDVTLELFAADAPGYVNNFVFLAQNQFYEGLTFHRVIPGFVAQAGDPTGAGSGSPGYGLEEETNALDFERGVISMAKSPTGQVNGSQFFITLGATPHLNDGFTVFGQVVDGLELVDGLTPRDPQDSAGDTGDTILSIEIIEREA
jgi:cyclophilin family peptidyl-prolyl cis-trans isomerase